MHELDEAIKVDTQLFTWVLLLADLNFSTFIAMPPARQIATAFAYGLSPRGLEIALAQVVKHMANRNELLKHIAERQLKAAN